MIELPNGWVSATLNDIAAWGAGGTPNRGNKNYYGGEISWVKTGDLGPRYLNSSSEKITQEGLNNSSAKIFPKGSIAIAMYGATIGKTSIFEIDAATNQACAVAVPFQGVNREFAYYLLNNEKEAFVKKGKGGAQPNISQTILKAHEILLPPENEQIQIANKLDGLLAKVDAAQARLDKIPTLLKRFRQSVLAAATSGQLTKEYRKNGEVSKQGFPESWLERSFKELGELARGKSKHRPRNDSSLYGGAYPFIQTGSIAQSDGWIRNHKKTYSELGLKQSRLFPEGTLCITIAANIANTAMLTYPVCFPDSVVGFIADRSQCEPIFIKYLIDGFKSELELLAPATAQKNINLGILNSLKLPIPSLEEQRLIVERVEQLIQLANSAELEYEKAKRRVDRLTQSILAKAFRGELVPQDPNDEPASVLLEKIQTERERLSQVKPKRKKATGKPMSKKSKPSHIMKLNEAPKTIYWICCSALVVKPMLKRCGKNLS